MASGRQPDLEQQPNGEQSQPQKLSEVLAEEYHAIHSKEITFDKEADTEKQRLKTFYRQIHEGEARTALCFSDGGIRSATFCLGVIQALAQKGILDQFHYLSTVSGGGYIGSWLTAWISREKDGLAGVCDALNNPSVDPLAPDPPPLHWLRTYSNYLSPKLGLFSADSWTLVGTYLRNLVLNWMIIIPLFAAILMIPRLHIAASRLSFRQLESWLLGGGLLLMLCCLAYLHLHRPSLGTNSDSWYGRLLAMVKDKESESRFIKFCLLPFLLSGVFLSLAWASYTNRGQTLQNLHFKSLEGCWLFATTGGLLHLIGWLLSGCWLMHDPTCKKRPDHPKLMLAHPGWVITEIGVIIATGLAGGALLWVTINEIAHVTSVSPKISSFAELYSCFAIPVFIGVFLLVASLFLGLASESTQEHDREWWGRSGSWILAMGLAWLAFSLLTVAGPIGFVTIPVYLASVGGISGLISVLIGFSEKTKATDGSGTQNLTDRLIEWLPKLAAPLCIVVLLAGISWSTSAAIEWLALSSPVGSWFESDAHWDTKGLFMPDLPSGHLFVLHHSSLGLLLALFGTAAIISLIFAKLVNINLFSLHALYRNRLIRAYLGASRGERSPNPFTGFDPCDNIELSSVVKNEPAHPAAEDGSPAEKTPIQRPFHIVNTAINLVRGENLAWQERKAYSFTLSPLHCGSALLTSSKGSDGKRRYHQLGYRPSQDYGKHKEGAGGKALTLGTALAISGAAASPNMGYHTSAPVAFLLTLFNVRLGWWLGNPGEAGTNTYKNSCPTFALKPLLAEAFGWTDAEHAYVYLSDGGHFENLGLYEMVVRRCRHIVVVDAGCDPDHKFTDLGNAIRKIRADLGIEVTIDLQNLKLQSDDRLVKLHYAVGEIDYDSVDGQGKKHNGLFLYVKPSLSLTRKEPADVLQYRAEHTSFPHESTVDQFFSESQFESYRKLGKWITNNTLGPVIDKHGTDLATILKVLKAQDEPEKPIMGSGMTFELM